MPISTSELVRATQLTFAGRLMEASRFMRRALGLAGATPLRLRRQTAPSPDRVKLPPVARPAAFTSHFFSLAGERYAYRLFVPAGAGTAVHAPVPLLVLLHGCKQDASDFALGTAMNSLAEQQNCIVLYPEQRAKANSMRCWNWFERAHQGRDAGEPAMLAALTREVLGSCQADPSRVYIAGLSAGGAMALLVASLHPGLFAAAGVHSGLPAGAASDAVSAFVAMRKGGQREAVETGRDAMPLIVFHGSADRTVHPANALHIVEDALAALLASGLALDRTEHTEEAGRHTLRTVYRAGGGKSFLEHWVVGAGPHAWSGGDAAGSFTDPQGPSASRAMLDFFLQHRQPAGARQQP